MILKWTPSLFPVFIRIILHLFPFDTVPVTTLAYYMPSDGSLNVRKKSCNTICWESVLGWEQFAAWSIMLWTKYCFSLFSLHFCSTLLSLLSSGKRGKLWNILNTVCSSPVAKRLPGHPWRKRMLSSWLLGCVVCQGTRAPAREPIIKILIKAVGIFHEGLCLRRQICLWKGELEWVAILPPSWRSSGRGEGDRTRDTHIDIPGPEHDFRVSFLKTQNKTE